MTILMVYGDYKGNFHGGLSQLLMLAGNKWREIIHKSRLIAGKIIYTGENHE